MIVAYSYVGNVAVNGGICADSAFVRAVLAGLLGFDLFMASFSGGTGTPHAIAVVNASSINLAALPGSLLMKFKVNGKN